MRERPDDDKAVARADRRYDKRERESRLLEKRSEDYQVVEGVFDLPTLKVIGKMVDDGVIKSVKSHFAAGKESKLYIAETPEGRHVAVKIYLTVSAEFKKRLQYITGDPRFSNIKKDTRSFIATWAKKEFKNLVSAHQAGVRVPEPITVERNVLVMEFIGDDEGHVAIPLAHGEVTQHDYDEVVDQIRKLYNKANLVHAYLSEYNIFKNTKGEVMFFDFGSAVDIRHPNSKQFLVRDIQNVNRFFAKRGIEVLDMDKFVERVST